MNNRIRDRRTEDGMVLVAERSLRVDRHAVHVAPLDRPGSQVGRYFVQHNTEIPMEYVSKISGSCFLADRQYQRTIFTACTNFKSKRSGTFQRGNSSRSTLSKREWRTSGHAGQWRCSARFSFLRSKFWTKFANFTVRVDSWTGDGGYDAICPSQSGSTDESSGRWNVSSRYPLGSNCFYCSLSVCGHFDFWFMG